MKARIDRRWPAIFVATLLFAGLAAASPGSPDAVIEGAVDELNEKLSGRKEELAKNREELYALINEAASISAAMRAERVDQGASAPSSSGRATRTAPVAVSKGTSMGRPSSSGTR